MPRRAFDSNGGIPPWVTLTPNRDFGRPTLKLGKPEPAFTEPEPTVYLSPDKVTCPTCGAEPQRPCERLSGGGAMHTWHVARERVE